MATLTVGYVSGFIAFALLLLQLILPNLLVLLYVQFLGHEQSALTWSVVSRELQSSFWPSVIGHDCAASAKVAPMVNRISKFRRFVTILLTITAITTPLGLYSRVELSKSSTIVKFAYAKDKGLFGKGTQPRTNNFAFSRRCGEEKRDGQFSCPDTVRNSNRNAPAGSVSKDFVDLFTSGLAAQNNSVSSIFDIQWRQYSTGFRSHANRFNTSSKGAFTHGIFSHLSTNLPSNDILLVEGLIVDYESAQLGFRNHAVPVGTSLGAVWEEDLLFIEPETACVNTNITFEYQTINDTHSGYIHLVDHGGFVGLKNSQRLHNASDPNNARLSLRAWNAARTNNYQAMLLLNITDPSPNSSNHVRSKLNEKFHIPWQPFHSYNFVAGFMHYGALVFHNGRGPLKNPWNVTPQDFQKAYEKCAGSLGFADSTDIAVECRLMYGLAKPIPGSDNSVFSRSIYSCATAVKASIKRVKLSYEAESCCDLKKLRVLEIREKDYASPSDLPHWGVEKRHRSGLSLSPLWGLVNVSLATNWAQYISTVQSQYLYLPGSAITTLSPFFELSTQLKFPGSTFHLYLMNIVYGRYVEFVLMGNYGLSEIWMNMSQDTTSAAKIPNLLFVDLAASAVFGAHGWLSANGTAQVPVHTYKRHTAYKWSYSAPAVLSLAITIVSSVLAAVLSLFGKANLSNIGWYLDRLSAGRLISNEGLSALSSKEWKKTGSDLIVDLRLVGDRSTRKSMEECRCTRVKDSIVKALFSPERYNTIRVRRMMKAFPDLST